MQFIYVMVAVLIFKDGTALFAPPQQMDTWAQCKAAAADWRNTRPDRSPETGKPIDRMYADCQIMEIGKKDSK